MKFVFVHSWRQRWPVELLGRVKLVSVRGYCSWRVSLLRNGPSDFSQAAGGEWETSDAGSQSAPIKPPARSLLRKLSQIVAPCRGGAPLRCRSTALDAIRGDLRLAELAAKYRVEPIAIATWNRQAVNGMASIFARACDVARPPMTAIDKNVAREAKEQPKDGLLCPGPAEDKIGTKQP